MFYILEDIAAASARVVNSEKPFSKGFSENYVFSNGFRVEFDTREEAEEYIDYYMYPPKWVVGYSAGEDTYRIVKKSQGYKFLEDRYMYLDSFKTRKEARTCIEKCKARG